MKALAPIRKLFQPKDLTKGSIPKVLLSFMIPIVLANVFQLLYTFTDAAIVGRNCSPEEYAGISASAIFVTIFLLFSTGCASGFSVILSSRIGAKDDAGVKKSFAHQLVLLTLVTIALTAIAIALIDPCLMMMGLNPHSSDPTMQLEYEAARIYLLIMYSGLFCTSFYNMIMAVLRALGDSFAPFLILLSCVILNVALDILFIVVFKWGAAGAAWGTIISQAIALIGAFVYALKKYKVLRMTWKDFKLEGKESWNHLKLGLPLGIQSAISILGFVFIQSTIISFDTMASGALLAATPCQVARSATTRVQNFLIAPMDALSIAVISFAAQNNGAKNQERLKKGFKIATIMQLIIWVIVSIIGLLLTINAAYIRIFLNPKDITEMTIYYGNTYLYQTIPFLWATGFVYLGRNYLQGLQKPLVPLLTTCVELVFRIVIPLTLPRAVNGWVLNAEVENLELAYFWLNSADIVCWLFSGAILMTAAYFALYPRKKKNGPGEGKTEEDHSTEEASEKPSIDETAPLKEQILVGQT